MKIQLKQLLIVPLLLFFVAAKAQVTKINVTTSLQKGANNSALITDNTGNVKWDAYTTIAPDQSTTNEIQALSIAGNVVSLSLGGGSVTLPAEVDGSVSNEIQTLSIASGVVSLSLGGGSVTLPDISATNEIQTLSIASNVVSLSLGGGSITLPTEVDGSVSNEIQTLSIAGNTISLSLGGGSVALPTGGKLRYVGRQVIATNTSSVTISGFTATADTDIIILRGGIIIEGGAANDWQRTGTTFSFANNPLLANEKLVYYEITP